MTTRQYSTRRHVATASSFSQRSCDDVASKHARCHSLTHPPFPGVTGKGKGGGWDWSAEATDPAGCRARGKKFRGVATQ
eukprot:1242553-Pleurochrysis_carterae.AAC.4